MAIPTWSLQLRGPKTPQLETATDLGSRELIWRWKGGGAQESDDITGQPLKDELLPMPLQLRSSGEWVGLLATAWQAVAEPGPRDSPLHRHGSLKKR